MHGVDTTRLIAASLALALVLLPGDNSGCQFAITGPLETFPSLEEACQEDAGIGVHAHVGADDLAEVVCAGIHLDQVRPAWNAIESRRDLAIADAHRQNHIHVLEGQFRRPCALRPVAPTDGQWML